MDSVSVVTSIELNENRVLVRKFSKLEKTKAGIILPEENHQDVDGGHIVAIGPLVDLVLLGKKVRYMEHGRVVDVDGEDHYLIRDTDIWCEIK